MEELIFTGVEFVVLLLHEGFGLVVLEDQHDLVDGDLGLRVALV